MPGQAIAARVAASLKKRGELMTLKRLPSTIVDVKGKRISSSGDPLVAGVSQSVVRIEILNAEIAAEGWPGPPRRGDKLTVDGHEYTLQADADTQRDSGAILCHFLTVKG